MSIESLVKAQNKYSQRQIFRIGLIKKGMQNRVLKDGNISKDILIVTQGVDQR